MLTIILYFPRNLSAFFFDDNEEAVPEEISAVSLKSIDDGVKVFTNLFD